VVSDEHGEAETGPDKGETGGSAIKIDTEIKIKISFEATATEAAAPQRRCSGSLNCPSALVYHRLALSVALNDTPDNVLLSVHEALFIGCSSVQVFACFTATGQPQPQPQPQPQSSVIPCPSLPPPFDPTPTPCALQDNTDRQEPVWNVNAEHRASILLSTNGPQ
jgi:hypothetical protein